MKTFNNIYLVAISIMPQPILLFWPYYIGMTPDFFRLVWASVGSVTVHVAIYEQKWIKWFSIFIFLSYEQLLRIIFYLLFSTPSPIPTLLIITAIKMIFFSVIIIIYNRYIKEKGISFFFNIVTTLSVYVLSFLILPFLIYHFG